MALVPTQTKETKEEADEVVVEDVEDEVDEVFQVVTPQGTVRSKGTLMA